MQPDTDADLAEIFALADSVVELVLEDRDAAPAEGREPMTLWDVLGGAPHLLALIERRLERALTRGDAAGEA